jgi:hypothetical protein
MLRLMAMRLSGIALLAFLLVGASGCTSEANTADSPQPPEFVNSLPDEFQHACGKPGSVVAVQAVPVTVQQADCDLTGVTIDYRGARLDVPQRGQTEAAVFDGVYDDAGAPSTSFGLVVRRAETGNVTVNIG